MNITVQKVSDDILKKLALFESDELAFSFYISSQIGCEPWGKIKTEINSIQAEGHKLLDDAVIEKRKKAELRRKIGEVAEHLNVFKIPSGVKALAVFVNGNEAKIITLPFLIECDVKLKRLFHIRHLAEALSRQNLYAILSVSRTKGRIIIINRGEILKASESIRDDVPRRTKSGEEERSGFGVGGARSHDLRSKNIDRHEEWHLEEHLKKIARNLFVHYWRKYKFEFLLVESLEDHRAKIKKILHPYLKPSFRVSWYTEPNESLDDIRKKGEEYFAKLQREEDEKIIKDIIEGVGKPNEFVSGVDETLDQLNQGTLRVIYVSQNLKTSGYYTKEAGDLAVYSAKSFLRGSEKIFTLDLVDAIVRKAILVNTKIRFMDNAELDKLGGLAGIFERY